MQETWWEYVQRISAGATQKDIAETTGLDQSSISRWKRDGTNPTAAAAVAFARAYRRPPVESLIAASYIERSETAGVIEVAASVKTFHIDDLLAEVRRRIPEDGQGWGPGTWERPVPSGPDPFGPPGKDPGVDRGENGEQRKQLGG